MGALLEQKPVKLIVSILYKDESFLIEAETFLVREYGAKEHLEAVFPFNFTDYYEKEFGEDLKRKVICFRKLVNLEASGEIKVFTNKIEDKLTKEKNKRAVNIDPGYVTEAKLVLFTTKDYSHRIYLGDKIFAEVTLHFQNNSFRSWPWSYPDYASKEMVEYFNKVRKVYMDDIKNDNIL